MMKVVRKEQSLVMIRENEMQGLLGGKVPV